MHVDGLNHGLVPLGGGPHPHSSLQQVVLVESTSCRCTQDFILHVLNVQTVLDMWRQHSPKGVLRGCSDLTDLLHQLVGMRAWHSQNYHAVGMIIPDYSSCVVDDIIAGEGANHSNA